MDRREFLKIGAGGVPRWRSPGALRARSRRLKNHDKTGIHQGHGGSRCAFGVQCFTRGAWKTLKPLGIHTVDIRKMGVKGVDAGPQQDVGSNVA